MPMSYHIFQELTYVSMRSVLWGTKYFVVGISFLFLIRTKYSAGFHPSFNATMVSNSSAFIPSMTCILVAFRGDEQ